MVELGERAMFVEAADDEQVIERVAELLGVTRVVMEATSDYWRPPFYLFEAHGLDPWLVNAKDVKHLPGPAQDRQAGYIRSFTMPSWSCQRRPTRSPASAMHCPIGLEPECCSDSEKSLPVPRIWPTSWGCRVSPCPTTCPVYGVVGSWWRSRTVGGPATNWLIAESGMRWMISWRWSSSSTQSAAAER